MNYIILLVLYSLLYDIKMEIFELHHILNIMVYLYRWAVTTIHYIPPPLQ